jgi:hypothetical protein
MIDLEEFKKILGDKNGLSEEDIIKLKENQENMAEIFFNSWLSENDI